MQWHYYFWAAVGGGAAAARRPWRCECVEGGGVSGEVVCPCVWNVQKVEPKSSESPAKGVLFFAFLAPASSLSFLPLAHAIPNSSCSSLYSLSALKIGPACPCVLTAHSLLFMIHRLPCFVSFALACWSTDAPTQTSNRDGMLFLLFLPTHQKILMATTTNNKPTQYKHIKHKTHTAQKPHDKTNQTNNDETPSIDRHCSSSPGVSVRERLLDARPHHNQGNSPNYHQIARRCCQGQALARLSPGLLRFLDQHSAPSRRGQ